MKRLSRVRASRAEKSSKKSEKRTGSKNARQVNAPKRPY